MSQCHCAATVTNVVRDRRGQTSSEYLGGLLLVAAIIAALVLAGVPSTVASETSRIVCEIAGGDCKTEAAAEPPDTVAHAQPAEGPAIGSGAELDVLPFPGSVSVTCGYSDRSEKHCKPKSGDGIGVKATGTVTAERTQTKLDGRGCPQQTISIATQLKLEGTAGREDGGSPKMSATLSAYIGSQLKYGVTVAPDQADMMARGERQPPNPLDPSTLVPNESIELSQEFWTGAGLNAQYGVLQAQLGYDRGRRVSSGVKRINDRKIRVYVGDEQFVRNAMAAGIGGKGLKVSASSTQEISDGKLRAVDIDIAQPGGWEAYQRFITTGRLPEPGAAGTSDPTSSTTRKLTDSIKAEAEIGKMKLGGLLKDAEGNFVETTNADGTVDRSLAIRYNDVGLEVTENAGTDGNRIGDRTYALNLEGVDPERWENFQRLNFREPTPLPDGHVRMEFTKGDLLGIREQALENMASELYRQGARPRPSTREVADALERNHGELRWGPHNNVVQGIGPMTEYFANRSDAGDVLEGLYRLADGDPNGLLAGPLTDFIMETNRANNGGKPTDRNRLPGAFGAPRCGR